MYIRWLGAFHKSASNGISESIDFEMSRTSVAACEHLQKKNKSYIWARVGLVIAKEGIIRKFDHDVWSLPDSDDPDYLKKHRDHAVFSKHHEAWCKPGFVSGIVTKIGEPIQTAFQIQNITGKINIRSIPSTKGEKLGTFAKDKINNSSSCVG